MPKEQYTTNLPDESYTSTSKDLLNTSLPVRTGPYRSISAKRPRDPSHRKSVSFNDVPIVHEVPSHDSMRSSNSDAYRSWTYTDVTPPTSVIPSLYSSQMLSPLISTSVNPQKLHANRLSSTLYTTSSTITTPNRIPDWAIRAKTSKPTSTAEETNEPNSIWNTPVIVVNTPDERLNKDTTVRNTNQSTYNNPYITYAQPTSTSGSSSLINPENVEEKKYPYRAPVIPDTDYFRSPPFTNGTLTNSTATYTSILSSNLSQSHYSSNEQPTFANSRTSRVRSAMLAPTSTQPPIRTNDTISITPFRAATAALSANGLSPSTRTILRPTTIAFQCSQPATTTSTMNTINNSPTLATTMIMNNVNTTNSSSTTTNTTKPPPSVSSRYSSSAAATAAAHSRFILPPNRTFSTPSLTSSAIKYSFTHPGMDSTLTNNITSQTTVSKPPPTAYPRSRSANSLSMRRTIATPVGMINGQSNGGTTTTTDPPSNLYSTTRRSPNVRQTYGSYYMHRVLLPTTTN
jgi:hypothetical protein